MTRTKYFKEPNSGTYVCDYLFSKNCPPYAHAASSLCPIIKNGFQAIFREITQTHRKKISSNQLFSNILSKPVTFTKFLRKQ